MIVNFQARLVFTCPLNENVKVTLVLWARKQHMKTIPIQNLSYVRRGCHHAQTISQIA